MLASLSVLALVACILTPQAFVWAISPADIPADTPISALLSSAQGHLARGETKEALVYFDAAVARDPDDYLIYFKRATSYLSLGRSSQAALDLSKVLSLKPKFQEAHVQLAKIKTRSADWDGARDHYVHGRGSSNVPEIIAIDAAEANGLLAKKNAEKYKWEECVSHASAAIVLASRAAWLRELRARCRLERGDVEEAIADLNQLLLLRPRDVAPLVQISALSFYSLGDIPAGLAAARKCLHSDQDSKICKKLLKDQKAIASTLTEAETLISSPHSPKTGIRKLVGSSDRESMVAKVTTEMSQLQESGILPARASKLLYSRIVEAICKGYCQDKALDKAKLPCEEVLELNPSSLFGLIYRGKSLLEQELYEEAFKTLQDTLIRHQDQRTVLVPLIQEAELGLKRSKNKNYYKVLGVSSDADGLQIKSAYRKLTKRFHPDKAFSQGLTKEAAQQKMATINEAYEILSDPELRARFDHGDDPNAQGQQQSQPFGGNAFQSHNWFQQQGGSNGQGQQFHFRFH